MRHRHLRFMLTVVTASFIFATAAIWYIRMPLQWDGTQLAHFRIVFASVPGSAVSVEALEIGGRRQELSPGEHNGGAFEWETRLSLPGQKRMRVWLRLRLKGSGTAVEAEHFVEPPLGDVCSLWITLGRNFVRIPDCVFITDYD